MINNITTVQEITLQAYQFGIYSILFGPKYDKSRDEIFNIFEKWAAEFEKAHEGYEWNGDYYDEIDLFLGAKKKELC